MTEQPGQDEAEKRGKRIEDDVEGHKAGRRLEDDVEGHKAGRRLDAEGDEG